MTKDLFIMFLRGFVFSVLILVSLHTPAQANDATAAKLKQALAEQITHAQAGQPYTLETSGEITVVPKDDYYTATLPGVQVSYAENMVFDIGTVNHPAYCRVILLHQVFIGLKLIAADRYCALSQGIDHFVGGT